MTSLIAAGGSGRSTSVIPAVPAASSVTTIAFIRDLPVAGRFMPPADGDRDHPARLVIAIGAFHTDEPFPTASYAGDTQRPRPRPRRGVAGAVFRTRRTMDMGLDDRPERDRRAAEA